MAVVYRAYDRSRKEYVALKVITASVDQRAEKTTRFLKEAKAAASLSGHQRIVKTLDVDIQGDECCLVMELVEGETLAKFAGGEPVAPEVAIDIMLQVCDAMGYAHSKGIIHRDLKPENIFVLPDGTVKVADFGHARDVLMVTVTGTGLAVGTPLYMSPEQARGMRARPASDIFAAGVILHELLVGENPFECALEETNWLSLVYAITEYEPPSVCDIDTELPVGLAKIVRRATEKDPALRYADFQEMMNDLTQVAEEFSGYEFHVTGSPATGRLIADYRPGEMGDTPHIDITREGELEEEGGQETADFGESQAEEAVFAHGEGEQVPAAAVSVGESPASGRKMKKPAKIAVASLIALLIIGGFVALALLVFTEPPPPAGKVRVPDVVGLQKDEASRTIETIGLDVGTEPVGDNENDPGTVLGQRPDPGDLIDEGGMVSITFAVPTKLTVPGVTGQKSDMANGILDECGLRYRVDGTLVETRDAALDGCVAVQTPEAGTVVDPGTEITLVLYRYEVGFVTCPTCGGTGQIFVPGTGPIYGICPYCGGDGVRDGGP